MLAQVEREGKLGCPLWDEAPLFRRRMHQLVRCATRLGRSCWQRLKGAVESRRGSTKPLLAPLPWPGRPIIIAWVLRQPLGATAIGVHYPYVTVPAVVRSECYVAPIR